MVRSRLIQPEATTRPGLEESVRVVAQPSLKGAVFGAETTKVILAEVGIIHEKRAIHIWEKPGAYMFLDQITHTTIHFLQSSSDSRVVRGGSVGEI